MKTKLILTMTCMGVTLFATPPWAVDATAKEGEA